MRMLIDSGMWPMFWMMPRCTHSTQERRTLIWMTSSWASVYQQNKPSPRHHPEKLCWSWPRWRTPCSFPYQPTSWVWDCRQTDIVSQTPITNLRHQTNLRDLTMACQIPISEGKGRWTTIPNRSVLLVTIWSTRTLSTQVMTAVWTISTTNPCSKFKFNLLNPSREN